MTHYREHLLLFYSLPPPSSSSFAPLLNSYPPLRSLAPFLLFASWWCCFFALERGQKCFGFSVSLLKFDSVVKWSEVQPCTWLPCVSSWRVDASVTHSSLSALSPLLLYFFALSFHCLHSLLLNPTFTNLHFFFPFHLVPCVFHSLFISSLQWHKVPQAEMVTETAG